MAKHKYKFNPETLTYVKVKRTAKQKVLYYGTYTFAVISLLLLFDFILGSFVDLPKDKALKRQHNELLANYELLKSRLTLLDSALVNLQERDDNIYRTIFETEPIHASIRQAGTGGAEKYKEMQNMEDFEIVLETAQYLDKLLRQAYVQSKSYDEVIELAQNKEDMLSAIPAIQPISNKDLKRTASGWGFRIHPIYKIRKFHYGMDFTAPTGTEIYSTGDGTISEIKKSKRGYGNKIVVDHGYGYKTLYAHLSGFNVRKGQKVKRGDVIGYVGNTGTSTAPHLHYEVILNGEKQNPVNYYFNDLTPEQWDIMIEMSINSGQTFD